MKPSQQFGLKIDLVHLKYLSVLVIVCAVASTTVFALDINKRDGDNGRAPEVLRSPRLYPEDGEGDIFPEDNSEQQLEIDSRIPEGGLRIHGTQEYKARIFALLRQISPYVVARQVKGTADMIIEIDVPLDGMIHSLVGTELLSAIINSNELTVIANLEKTDNALANDMDLLVSYSDQVLERNGLFRRTDNGDTIRAFIRINPNVYVKLREYSGYLLIPQRVLAKPGTILAHELVHVYHTITNDRAHKSLTHVLGTYEDTFLKLKYPHIELDWERVNGKIKINRDLYWRKVDWTKRIYRGQNNLPYFDKPEEVNTAGVEFRSERVISENTIRKEHGITIRNDY